MTLRSFLAVAVLAVGATAPAHTQSSPDTVVQGWLKTFNAGDMAKAASFNSPAGISIIDEFAPYAWSGPKAFDDWGATFGADAKSSGLTEPKVTMSAPLIKNLAATQAYLVYPSVYTYKLKGVAMREAGRMAIVLRKEDTGWKIASWAWTGTVPKPAK